MGSATRQLVLVSGLSGGGKSTALRALEDLGFYCVDNLPAGLLPDFVQQVGRRDHPEYARIALGVVLAHERAHREAGDGLLLAAGLTLAPPKRPSPGFTLPQVLENDPWLEPLRSHHRQRQAKPQQRQHGRQVMQVVMPGQRLGRSDAAAIAADDLVIGDPPAARVVVDSPRLIGR